MKGSISKQLRLTVARLLESRVVLATKQTLFGLVAVFHRSARWDVYRAQLNNELGVIDRAIRASERAISRTGVNPSPEEQRLLHIARFNLEKAFADAGRPREEDPLFSCAASEESESPEHVAGAPVGLFRYRFEARGFRVSGIVVDRNVDVVEICLDGTCIRRVNVLRQAPWSTFRYIVRRRGLDTFPATSRLSLRDADGRPLVTYTGKPYVSLTIPHGDGTVIDAAASGRGFNKKGVLPQSAEERAEGKRILLSLYARLRDAMDRHAGRRLFLMYGTLLGYYRDGDLIEGDDDFDVGYVADADNPAAVRDEVIDLICTLVCAGYTVSINHRGRPFRVSHDDLSDIRYHMDIRPIWFQDGYAWAHNHFRMPAERADFLPVLPGELGDTNVYIPRNTDKLLLHQYGEGWRVPDPGFRYYASKMDPAIFATLDRLLLGSDELNTIRARIERARAAGERVGRFIPFATTPLYPLSDSREVLT